MRSNRFFNLFDKRFNLGTFCSSVLTVVPTIILPVTIIITLGVLGVNAVAIRAAVVLRAVFARVIRHISTTVLLTRTGIYALGESGEGRRAGALPDRGGAKPGAVDTST